jgi:hypothetical protein
LCHHQPTKTYIARRLAQGKTNKELIRFLKRDMARESSPRSTRPAQPTHHPLTSIRASDHESGLAAGADDPHPRAACGLLDGLAHEPRRHGVQPVRVVLPGCSGRP